jgi:peptidoglycan/LPS O-acetylase OafA/YrhL
LWPATIRKTRETGQFKITFRGNLGNLTGAGWIAPGTDWEIVEIADWETCATHAVSSKIWRNQPSIYLFDYQRASGQYPGSFAGAAFDPRPRMETKDAGKYIPQLTGIRAISAYMVFVHNVSLPAGVLPPILAAMASEMHVGVTLFFVLSGFLIYWNYADTVELNGAWLANYLTNRLARIYPIFFLMTCATLMMQMNMDSMDWFLNLTFLRGFSEPLKYTGVPQGWSLTPEWCFYVLAPFFFVFIKRRSILWPLLGSYLLGGLLMVVGHFVNFYHFFRGWDFMLGSTFFGRCFEFFAGVFLARYLSEGRAPDRSRKAPLYTWGALGLIALTVYAMAKLESPDYQYGGYSPLGRVLNNFVLPVFYCLFFFGLVTERSLPRHILASSTMDLLGKSSYVFYLIHTGLFISLLSNFLPMGSFLTSFNSVGAYIIAFILLNLAAIVIYFVIERPANKFIRRTMAPRAARADAPAPETLPVDKLPEGRTP